MKETRLTMGMPVTIEIVDKTAKKNDLEKIFAYFNSIDRKFSTYKKTSEISRINRDEISKDLYSEEMSQVLKLCEQTKHDTQGYFNIEKRGLIDPSGLVKGWTINNAANILRARSFHNFYIDAGGDIQANGKNSKGKHWRVGIRSPFNLNEIIKVLIISNEGVATSGTYIRGQHIYNPFIPEQQLTEIVSITVIGPNIYEADRFATAAFAMGNKGIQFIETIPHLEAYMIDKNGIATMTTNFELYTTL